MPSLIPLLLLACPAPSTIRPAEDALVGARITSSQPLYPDSWFRAEVEAVEGYDGDLVCRWMADGFEVAQGSCSLDGLGADIPSGAELRVVGLAMRDGVEVDAVASEPVQLRDFPVAAVTEMGGGSLSFLDTSRNELVDRVDLILDPEELGVDATSSATEKAGFPMHVLHTPERDKLLVTSSNYGVIWEVDPVTREAERWAQPSGQNYWLSFSDDGERIAMSDMEYGGLTVLDRDYAVLGQVETGGKPLAFLHHRESGWIYLCHHESPYVAVVDLESLEVVDEIGASGSYWVTPHSDGESIWVVTEHNDAVSRYSLPDHELLASHTVDDLPNYIHLVEGGSRAYVTSFREGLLTYIDTDSGEILDRVDAGTGAVAIIPRDDGRFLYVPNVLAGSISVIDTTTNLVVDMVYDARGARWLEWLDAGEGG